MKTIRCRFCHQMVDPVSYPAHEAEHLASRPDGQQNMYVTLPPEDRATASLDGVPSVQLHLKCQVATRMPEEIIRSYLADPHLYAADATFCCGCGTHVPNHECVWVDTGEDLQSYMNHLRQPKAHASQSVTSTPTKPAPPFTLTDMGPGDFIVQTAHALTGRAYPPFLVHAKDEAAARALCNRNYLILQSVQRYVEQPGQPKPQTFRFGPPVSDRDFEWITAIGRQTNPTQALP